MGMLKLDRAVTENFCRVMRQYFSVCDIGGKADTFYDFEIVVKFQDVPVAKVMTKNGDVDWHQIGGRK